MLKATGSAMLFNGLNFEPVERGLNFEPTSAEAVGIIMTWNVDGVDRGFTGHNFEPSARAGEHGHNFVPMLGGEGGGAEQRVNGHIFEPITRRAERELKIQPLPYCYHDLRSCMLDVHGLKFQPMFEGEEGGARLC